MEEIERLSNYKNIISKYEGIVRKHIFKNNKYLDMHMYFLHKGKEDAPMD